MIGLPRRRLVVVKIVVFVVVVVWLIVVAKWLNQASLVTDSQHQDDTRDIERRLGHAHVKTIPVDGAILKESDAEKHTKVAQHAGRTAKPTPIALDYAILKTQNVVLRAQRKSTFHTWVDVPDTACKKKTYGDVSVLPSASVVSSFHTHEDLLEILHTLHSLVQRSPARLLREIVIVDDHSVNEAHKTILDNYIAAVFKGTTIRIYRSPQQLGLIQARNVGIRLARGPVVVVMDIHCEVQEHWLEGLLWEIKKDNRTMASPCLDWMYPAPKGTWTYEHGSGSTKTFWNWDCAVGFDHMSDNARAKIKDKTAAIVNPANIGTFAIDKTFFNDIGAYDEDMWGWGGENIDLSLRVWLFGGRIVKVPCSHMAHLEKKGYRDYRSKWYWDTMANFRRVVDLWGDNYTQTFFDFLPDVEKVGAQNLTKRLYLKKKAKHDISWYFKNVYPELLDTLPNVDSYAYGGARNKATDQCLDRSRNTFTVYPCHYLVGTQGFFLNTRGQLRHHSAVISVFVLRKGHSLWPDTFIRAYGRRDLPKWIHWKGGPIMDITHNVCLEARRLDTRSESGSKSEVTLEPCQFTNPYQQWTFRNYTTNYEFLVGDTYVARNGTAEYQMLKLYASYQSSTTSQRPTKGT